ncbi:MAG: dTDP-4-dehydrorhamnose 3,5-epimerase [Saprospiraceae bacterium]|jgi:dTDP-4-dehydrorhamnose 3,5-epimerase
MRVINEFLNGAKLIEPDVFQDGRGSFYESFNQAKLKSILGDVNFVQDNQSLSEKHVLRGLHFQKNPYSQGKLVRVISGSVLDVIVDLRQDSPSYGKHESVVLSGKNLLMLWVPPGFAHGFLTLEDNTLFFYKVSNYYNKESEVCLKWDDKSLGINWNCKSPFLSSKDKQGISFSGLKDLF